MRPHHAGGAAWFAFLSLKGLSTGDRAAEEEAPPLPDLRCPPLSGPPNAWRREPAAGCLVLPGEAEPGLLMLL